MAKAVKHEECDSADGIRKLFQKVFDNQEQLNAKICQMEGVPVPVTESEKGTDNED